MPLTLLAYEPDFGESSPIPADQIPRNWLDLFVKALLASGLTDSNLRLQKQFARHIGPNSRFDFKNELQLELQQLYKRFTAKGDNQLTPDRKTAIATKIQEGISTCSVGFYNRVILINQSFLTPNTLKALLTRIRHNIVNTAAINALATSSELGYHVHIYNRFFLIASQNFGVQSIQKKDPYPGPIPDPVILEQLQQALKLQYHSPIHLFTQLTHLIQSILEEQFYYTGRNNKGCSTPDTHKWVEYLEKIGIPDDSCLLLNYPYTDKEGQAVLFHSSSSPVGKSPDELKAMLNNHDGLIFFENTLFYTDFSAQNNNTLIQILYEFSDQEDEDANQVRYQFLALPLDANPSMVSLSSAQQLDEIRTKLGMQAINGTIVDLNWPKIKLSLLTLLVQKGFLKFLTPSEQFMLELFKQESTLTDMTAFYHLIKDGLILDVKDFILFLDLFNHLNFEKRAQLIHYFMISLSQDQYYESTLKLLEFLKKDSPCILPFQEYLEKYCNSKQIDIEINKLAFNKKNNTILELHDLARKHKVFHPFFQEFIRHYSETELLLSIIHGKNLCANLSLLDYLEDDKKLLYLKKIYYSSTNISVFNRNAFLESFLNCIFNAKPKIQESLLTSLNSLNDNLLTDVIFYNYNNLALISKLLALISTCNKKDIATVFSTQNRKDKNNALLYAYQQGSTQQLALPMVHIIKELSAEDQCFILKQSNIKKQNVFQLAATSKEIPVLIELIQIIGQFALPFKKDCIGELLCNIERHLPFQKNLESWVIILDCIEANISELNHGPLLTPISSLLVKENPINVFYIVYKRWLEKTPVVIKNCILLGAIGNKNQALINEILSYGVEVNYIRDPEFTERRLSALDLALNTMQFDLVHTLLAQNPPELTDTQLVSVCSKLHNHKLQDLKLLLFKQYPKKLPVTIKNQLLFDAINTKNQELIKKLLSEGADANYLQPFTNKSMLMFAIENDLDDVANIMLEMELETNTLESMVYSLASIKSDKYSSLIEKILKKNPCLNLNKWAGRSTGNYTLHEAIINQCPFNIINLMCEVGADITKVNKSNKSPLDLALELGQFEVAKILIASHTSRLNEAQLLFISDALIKGQQAELVLALNWRYPNNIDRSLYSAVHYKNQGLAKELLAFGANSLINNNSALNLVVKTEQFELLSLILKNVDIETTGIGRRMIHSKTSEKPLSWNKLEYILDSTHWNNKALFTALVEIHLSTTQLPLQSQELVRTHALACFNYLMTHSKKTQGVNARKIFLNRLLFENFNSEDDLKTEIHNYMLGNTVYSQKSLGIFSTVKPSRVAYAYNLGLFGPHAQPFESLPKKERKRIISTL